MAIELFNPTIIEFLDTTGYEKVPKSEFWKQYNEKDDYILDNFEYCRQDLDGDVWVPNPEKVMELEAEQIEWELDAQLY